MNIFSWNQFSVFQGSWCTVVRFRCRAAVAMRGSGDASGVAHGAPRPVLPEGRWGKAGGQDALLRRLLTLIALVLQGRLGGRYLRGSGARR